MEVSAKTKYYIKLIIVTAVVYFSLKYLLPMFLPFLAAYFLVYLLRPIVRLLNQRFKINRKLSSVILLGILVAVLGVAICFITNAVIKQIKNFCSNYVEYEKKLDHITDKACDVLEKYSGIESREIKVYVDKGIDTVSEMGTSEETVNKVMNKSISTVILIGELFVFVLTMIISSYYMLNNNEKSNNKENGKKKTINNKGSVIYKDIRRLTSKVGHVCIAYIKTQLIIMAITSVICFISFMFINNDYALLLALIVGFLDALPLIGVGLILIPWGLVYLILGEYVKAVIIFITFVICYLVREFLEPRLMGNQIGITPLATIVAMYVGYKVFGVIGVILGPVGYILIDTLMEMPNEKF